MRGIIGGHFDSMCLFQKLFMSVSRKIRWIVLLRTSSRNLIMSKGNIVSARDRDTFDVACLTRAETILPFHAHYESHSRNVTKWKDEICMKQECRLADSIESLDTNL